MTALIAAVLVLLVGAALCLLPLRNAARAGIGIASQVVATALVWATVMPVLLGAAPVTGELAWAYPVGTLRVRLDALGAFFLAWSLPMTLLGTVYAVGYLRPYFARGAQRRPALRAAQHDVARRSCSSTPAQNALVFLLGWEIAAVAAWLLVIWDYRNQKIRFAGFNYLVSTHVGLFVLVAAFMLLHSQTGVDGLRRPSAPSCRKPESPTAASIFLLLGASFALKSAFFPFHTWLPRAHSAAPAHVSALMSGVIHKAGLFALPPLHAAHRASPSEWMGWYRARLRRALGASSACSTRPRSAT